MINDFLNLNWYIALYFSLFWGLKMFRDAIKTNYSKVKKTLHIPDKWDWYCNPQLGWHNKDKNWFWKLLTPFSDLWHTLASLMCLCVLLALNATGVITFWQLVYIAIIGIFIFGNLIYYYSGAGKND